MFALCFVHEGAPRAEVWVTLITQIALLTFVVTMGIALQVTPEFEDVAAYAREHGRAEREVMAEALAAAGTLGFRAGSMLPD